VKESKERKVSDLNLLGLLLFKQNCKTVCQLLPILFVNLSLQPAPVYGFFCALSVYSAELVAAERGWKGGRKVGGTRGLLLYIFTENQVLSCKAFAKLHCVVNCALLLRNDDA
jgi:hypothetical protein